MQVVLANKGPPPVMTNCKSKKFTDHIVIKMRLITMKGLSKGSVIRKKDLNFVAPSITAASYIDGFIDNNPAVIKSMVNGVPYHTFAITKDQITILGSESQPTGCRPIC